MYAKLIFRNVRRSLKDYLIYMVTMTLCVMLFYAFLSISSSYYSPDIGIEYDLTMLSDGMKMAICVVTLLLLFLIHYVNSYMLRRKQKQFAVQTVMGMERSTTSLLFFGETFIMGLFSIGIGIMFGIVCSQFITAMLLSSYGRPFHLSWMLYPDTVLLTVCFFAGSFLLVGLFNIRTIRKMKVIDMLYAEKVNEEDFRKSRWMPVVSLIYGILLCYMVVTGILSMIDNFDTRFAFAVHAVFWGNILVPAISVLCGFLLLLKRKKCGFQKLIGIWMVCSVTNACFAAAVPDLRLKYYMAFDAGTINLYLMFLLADLSFFICSVIYLANDVMRLVKERSIKCRYREENLFFFGQVMSRLSAVTKTMTLICLTLVLSVCLFLSVPALVGWASGYLESRSVYDVQIFSGYNDVYEETDLLQEDYSFVTDYLMEHDIKTVYDRTFDLYLPQKKEFYQRNKYEFPVLAISITDYNYLLTMRGYEPVKLNEGEIAIQWEPLATEKEQREFLENHEKIETDAGTLAFSREQQYSYSLGETLSNSYTNAIYVFPDGICRKLLAVNRNRYMKTAEPIPYENALALEKVFAEEIPQKEEEGIYYIRTSTQQINSSRASNFVLQASMTYGAVVLLVICFTILSLQQLSDAVHYKYRFGVLRKLGVDESKIGALILRQLAVWFGLPVVIAAGAATVLILYFFRMISVQIAAYIGMGALLTQVGIILLILLALLGCYFISTWLLFKRTITE